MRDLAQRLLAYEATAESAAPPVFRVCEALRHFLSPLTGIAGFQSLLARALTLAKRDDPRLSVVRVSSDGFLDGQFHGHHEAAEAGVALVAQVLELLATLVGQTLTLHLIRGAWPDLPFDDPNPGEYNHHEPTR